MSRFGWPFALAVTSATLACSSPPPAEIGWTVELGSGLEGSEIRSMEVAIRRGDCAAAPFYEVVLDREAAMGPPPGTLEAGVYCLTGRARSNGCEWVATGETLFELPTLEPVVLLTLEASSPETLCSPAEECSEGTCEPLLRDCGALAPGASCGLNPGFVCIDGSCAVSRCGDGVTDTETGEQCDDANDVSGDGCEPLSCVFSCTEEGQCDDGDECTFGDVCTVDHFCAEPRMEADLTACRRATGPGVCRIGQCVGVACGNGLMDPDEDCDDGNEVSGDGCESDCTYSCVLDAQCIDANPCNGRETCDLDSHTCAAAEALDCDDGDPCTEDACDETAPLEQACVNVFIDADADGVAPGTCVSSDFAGGDCDDADPARAAGALETCDGVDNDCDDTIDEEAVMATCYADADGDGYGSPVDPVSACDCGALTDVRVSSSTDCHDIAALAGDQVNPGITGFASNPYCRPSGATCTDSFDYNCNGTEEPRWRGRADCSCERFTSGWSGTPPTCGEPGTWATCKISGGPGGPIPVDGAGGGGMMMIGCVSILEERTQECR